jgi:cytochrome c biogenesis protein CcmG/thiol:disulfide interchange protein DsbE
VPSQVIGDELTTLAYRFSIFVALILIVSACADGGPVGDPPPSPRIPSLTADQFEEILVGSETPALVNVWASWCIPCRSEAPLLRQAHAAFGDEIRFIGINIRDTQDAAQAFLEEFGIDFENFFDPQRRIPAALGGSGVPLTYFFAPGGELVYFQPGVIDERTLALQIDELTRRGRSSKVGEVRPS